MVSCPDNSSIRICLAGITCIRSLVKSANKKLISFFSSKVSKGAKIRNQYNQVTDLNKDTNWKVTNSQLDTINESQEVSPLLAGDYKVQINRHAQRHNKHKTEKT